jgi:Rieske Fe-S protein
MTRTSMTRTPMDRRTVLRGAAVAGVGAGVTGALVACGDDSAGDAASPPAASTTADSIGGAATPVPVASANALGAATAVPVGGGKIFEDAKVVVTQPTAGNFKAFSATCTHQGCLVSQVSNDTITCACHGSAFSAKDGSVVNGPATRPLKEQPVSETGGQLSLG